MVAEWLQMQGVDAQAYYADIESDGETTRVELEQRLMRNQLKALVASVALGVTGFMNAAFALRGAAFFFAVLAI